MLELIKLLDNQTWLMILSLKECKRAKNSFLALLKFAGLTKILF